MAGLSCWPWSLMLGCSLTKSAGMLTVAPSEDAVSWS